MQTKMTMPSNTVNRSCISFLILVLAVAMNTGIANAAGSVAITYQLFPSGNAVPGQHNLTLTGASACLQINGTIPNYDFLFWNIAGVIELNPIQNICSSSVNTSATAWYLAPGGPPCNTPPCPPPPPTAASTFAFSLDLNKVLAGTPIASVSPNTDNAWTAPSTSVSTKVTEMITAQADINITSPAETEAFQYWLPLGGNQENTSASFTADKGTSPIYIAFYNTAPPAKSCNPGPLPKLPSGVEICGPLKPGANQGTTMIWCQQLCACVEQSACPPH